MACDQQSTEPLPHLGALVINMSLITGMYGPGSGAAAESGKSISKLRCIVCWDDMLPMMGLWFVDMFLLREGCSLAIFVITRYQSPILVNTEAPAIDQQPLSKIVPSQQENR